MNDFYTRCPDCGRSVQYKSKITYSMVDAIEEGKRLKANGWDVVNVQMIDELWVLTLREKASSNDRRT